MYHEQYLANIVKTYFAKNEGTFAGTPASTFLYRVTLFSMEFNRKLILNTGTTGWLEIFHNSQVTIENIPNVPSENH